MYIVTVCPACGYVERFECPTDTKGKSPSPILARVTCKECLSPMPTLALFCTFETSPRPLHPSMLPSSKVKDEYWLGETVGVGLGLPLPLPLTVGYVGCGCLGAVVGTGVGGCLSRMLD